MTELATNQDIEFVHEEREDVVEETISNEMAADNETGTVQEEVEKEVTAMSSHQSAAGTPKDNEFKRGFIFGLGFWAAGALVLSVPFGAILFAVYSVMTTML
ncbi:MAG TPA: hypothetical protein VFC74_10470 [Oscillospiraceae bacterium]|nr:hypothetical protein [Oscillospiraceae bacterium]